jgi:hypothetical protein
MKRSTAKILAAMALALTLIGSAHARQDDIDISRLSGSLDQLADDPGMGAYAQAEQARARDAINRLAQEEASRLQQQGEEYSQAADQARAEADRAKKLAAAQSKVAKAARRQAALAAEAAKAMRSQMEDSSQPAEPAPSPAKTHR